MLLSYATRKSPFDDVFRHLIVSCPWSHILAEQEEDIETEVDAIDFPSNNSIAWVEWPLDQPDIQEQEEVTMNCSKEGDIREEPQRLDDKIQTDPSLEESVEDREKFVDEWEDFNHPSCYDLHSGEEDDSCLPDTGSMLDKSHFEYYLPRSTTIAAKCF
jgi:hypothetical protein